jgi:acetyl esterase/lipase
MRDGEIGRRDETEQLIELGCGTAVAIRVLGTAPGHNAPLVLHLHGGAFGAGAPGCGHAVASLLVDAGAVVISAEYPTGREYPFPAALEVVYALLHRLHKDRTRWAGRASRVFVAGEEAGGNLAAALAMMARDRHGPPLAGQILLSPMLDAGMATCSIRTANAGPVGCKWADGWHDYLGSPERASHPYATPAAASRLAGLAPALVLTAEDCPMRDESLGYAGRLRDHGVTVQSRTIPAPTHWPDALGQSTPIEASWKTEVRAAFAVFLAAPTHPPQSASAAF